MEELNKLISHLQLIIHHLNSWECDPLLQEDLHEKLTFVELNYGQLVNNILFGIYDEYCEDYEIKPLMDYISDQGVLVQIEDFSSAEATIGLKCNPLRFEIEFETSQFSDTNFLNGNTELYFKMVG